MHTLLLCAVLCVGACRMDALLANLQQTEEEKARLQEQVKKHADDVKHSER